MKDLAYAGAMSSSSASRGTGQAQPPSASAPAQAGTPSPCVRLCTLNDEDVCVGCGRTLGDITRWTRMSEEEKTACVHRARETLRRLGRPIVPPGR